jgi:hypothetical protein
MEVVPMKRLTLIGAMIFALSVCLSLPVFADPPAREAHEAQKRQMEKEREHVKEKKEVQKEMRKHSGQMDREDRMHHEEMGRGYRNRPDYHTYSGYRGRPYQRGRHYEHYDYKGKRYDYHGHWRSWDEWDKYAKKHPYIYRHGGYYHEGGHLMFRFCDPSSANCVFFSIGR